MNGSIAQDTEDNKMATEKYLVYADDYHLNINGEIDGKKVEGFTESNKEIINSLKKQYVQSFFSKNIFNHIIVLSGAGTSRNSGGKTREGLWDACKNEIDEVKKSFQDAVPDFDNDKDIEGFLSYANRYSIFKIQDDNLRNAITSLKNKIRTQCILIAKEEEHSHADFLRKLTSRKSSLPRIEVYTLNYDTLFEQAANNLGMIIIDGFSFSHPRTFSGRNFDLDIVNREHLRLRGEENFIPNVFHLLKLHGSVDWYKDGDKVIQSGLKEEKEPVMIYPSSEKYEESYEQPYFELMSRFHTALRREETLLIILGFGFADRHISNAIVEAVNQNPSFQLMIVDYGLEGKQSNYINLDLYKKIFKNLGAKITIVQDSFSEFASSIPLNSAYAEENHNSPIGISGESYEYKTI